MILPLRPDCQDFSACCSPCSILSENLSRWRGIKPHAARPGGCAARSRGVIACPCIPSRGVGALTGLSWPTSFHGAFETACGRSSAGGENHWAMCGNDFSKHHRGCSLAGTRSRLSLQEIIFSPLAQTAFSISTSPPRVGDRAAGASSLHTLLGPVFMYPIDFKR